MLIFFGVFFVISWVFYDANIDFNDFMNSFNIVGQIWIYQALCTNLSVSILTCIGILIGVLCWGFIAGLEGWYVDIRDAREWRHRSVCCCKTFRDVRKFFKYSIKYFFAGIFGLIGAIILCVIAIVLGFIMSEILNYTLLSTFLYVHIESEIPTFNNHDHTLYSELDRFITQYKSHYDRFLRVLCIQKIGFEMKILSCHRRIHQFIVSQETKQSDKQLIPFNNIGFKHIAIAHNKQYSTKRNKYPANLIYTGYCEYIKPILDESFDIFKDAKSDIRSPQTSLCTGILVIIASLALYIAARIAMFIFIPLYIVSRVFKIIFPVIIIIYIGINNLWLDTDLFQMFMLTFYMIILLPLWLLLYNVLILYHSRWYITLGKKVNGVDSMRSTKLILKNVNKYYNSILAIPFRRQLLINKFGRDIGDIIDKYLPWFE